MVPLKGVSNNSDEPEISGALVRFRSKLLAHREDTNARLEQMETSLRTAMATLLEDFQASLMEGLNSLVAGRNSTRRAPETAPPDGAVRFGSVTSPVLAHKDASSIHARSEGPPLLQLNSGGNSSAHSYSKSNPGVHLPCVGLDSMNMCIDASLGVRNEVMGVKKDKMQAGDVDVGSSVDFVQGRFAGGDYGGVQPLFGQMVAECHALKVFDEMPKSKGLCSVEKSVTRIRDKGGGLAQQPKSSETYSAQEDKNANRSVEKNDQIDDGHAMLKVELSTLFIERDDVLAHKKTGVVDGIGIGESHVVNGQILADKVEVQKQLETEAFNCHDFYKSGDESFIIHDHEESISERIDTKHLGNTPVGNKLCEKGAVLAAFDEVQKQLGTPFLSGPIPDQSEDDLSGVHSYQKSISEPDWDDTTAGIGSSCKAYGCDNVPSERSFSIVADQVDYVKYFSMKGQLEPKRQKCSPMFTWISGNKEGFNQEDPQNKNKLADLRATDCDIRSFVVNGSSVTEVSVFGEIAEATHISGETILQLPEENIVAEHLYSSQGSTHQRDWCKPELREKAILVAPPYPCRVGAILNGKENLVLHFLISSGGSFELTFSLVISLIELWKYGFVEQNMIWFTNISVTSFRKECLKFYNGQGVSTGGIKCFGFMVNRIDDCIVVCCSILLQRMDKVQLYVEVVHKGVSSMIQTSLYLKPEVDLHAGAMIKLGIVATLCVWLNSNMLCLLLEDKLDKMSLFFADKLKKSERKARTMFDAISSIVIAANDYCTEELHEKFLENHMKLGGKCLLYFGAMELVRKLATRVKHASGDEEAKFPNAILHIIMELVSWETVSELVIGKRVVKKVPQENVYESPNEGDVDTVELIGKLQDGKELFKVHGDSVYYKVELVSVIVFKDQKIEVDVHVKDVTTSLQLQGFVFI